MYGTRQREAARRPATPAPMMTIRIWVGLYPHRGSLLDSDSTGKKAVSAAMG